MIIKYNHNIVLGKLTPLNLNSKNFLLSTVPFWAVPIKIYESGISILYIRNAYSKISSINVKIGAY